MGFWEDWMKHNHRHSHHDSHHLGMSLLISGLKRISRSRTLILFIIMVLILILIAFVALLAMLWPLLGKLITYISLNGIKGVVDFLTALINRIWEGAPKG